MSKKILVPLDGSDIGEAALRYVEEMVSALKVSGNIEVTLIHILIPPTQRLAVHSGYGVGALLTEEEIVQMKQMALEYLEKSGEGLRIRGVDVSCKVVVGETNISSAEEIIKAEKDLEIDLVAMSTHGRRGISRWAFGSVTEKVLQGGNVPVLVVRAKK
ncbi:MAG: universal stress protein [Deltaproteobacteria bacterium]|nr:universal stress protein [Deltaproteobacteria bacterium]